jgi:acetyltransferase-like isoleucine patch superfamily enzyme
VSHSTDRAPFEDPLALLPRVLTKLNSIWISRTYPFAAMGRNVSFHHTIRISRRRSPRISIGNSVRLSAHAALIVATGDPRGKPTIVIEDGCQISEGSIISARNEIQLEPHVNIAQQVIILDHNHAYEDIDVPIIRQGITNGGRIRIGEGSWIGHGAAILCSRGQLTIGRHCVVSANAVVTRSIPDYSVVFGNPAMIIRQYDPAVGRWRMGEVKRATGSDRENRASLNGAQTECAEGMRH